MAGKDSDLVERTTSILKNALKELEDFANDALLPTQAQTSSNQTTSLHTAQLRASENFRYGGPREWNF